ncbi:hypothetical protein SNEBB_005290 [Seison nebaliae]|nr:hypothetical protein SNEBB_005290 [Seison nebaliae]
MTEHRHVKENLPTLKIQHYSLRRTLGKGSFGKVRFAVHDVVGVNVAIKIINREVIKEMAVVSKVKREIRNMHIFNHPHIIRLYEVISTPSDIYMVMEYVSGGELFDYIVREGGVGEVQARKFFQQIISGVAYCHEKRVVHRDLKPENLLLDEYNNVKIADFGLSNMMEDGEFLKTSCGSPNYAAPEVISGKLYPGPEVDIWSCGVILYALLCGTLPFDDEDVTVLFRKIKNGLYHTPNDMPEGVRDLIRGMLTVDSLKRTTLPQIIEHHWFIIDCPGYLFNYGNYNKMEKIDWNIVRQVSCRFNRNEELARQAIINNYQSDEINIAYHLLKDAKTKNLEQHFGMSSLEDFHRQKYMANSVPDYLPRNEFLSSFTSSYAPASSNLDSQNYPQSLHHHLHQSQHHHNNIYRQKIIQLRPRRRPSKWHLGIRSQSQQLDILYEVFRAMRTLKLEWSLSRYNAWQLNVRRHGNKNSTIVRLQFFRVDSRSYLLDFSADWKFYSRNSLNNKMTTMTKNQTTTTSNIRPDYINLINNPSINFNEIFNQNFSEKNVRSKLDEPHNSYGKRSKLNDNQMYLDNDENMATEDSPTSTTSGCIDSTTISDCIESTTTTTTINNNRNMAQDAMMCEQRKKENFKQLPPSNGQMINLHNDILASTVFPSPYEFEPSLLVSPASVGTASFLCDQWALASNLNQVSPAKNFEQNRRRPFEIDWARTDELSRKSFDNHRQMTSNGNGHGGVDRSKDYSKNSNVSSSFFSSSTLSLNDLCKSDRISRIFRQIHLSGNTREQMEEDKRLLLQSILPKQNLHELLHPPLTTQHQVMEFLEICADLIATLAQ